MIGGLGLTSDDFICDVVADWAEKKMSFDETLWEQIQNCLIICGFIVRDMQKQQCYYFEGSEILFNFEGMANGFRLSNKNTEVFVLPGSF